AVKNSKMENWNGVPYTSLLPPDAKQVPVPKNYSHGSELMMIMACCNCKKGQKANAALGRAWVYNKDKNIGGLVAEFSKVGKNIDEKIAEEFLNKSLNEMFERREYPSSYELKNIEMIGYESIVPEKKFGTALVAIGFVEYKTSVKLIK
ncbi:MAG: pyruvoyl-dependent arginine decarboxylase, partial [Candidatus Aenigmatarchaeota archaeon]